MAPKVGFADLAGGVWVLSEHLWMVTHLWMFAHPAGAPLDLLTKEVENTELSILGKVNNDHSNNLTTQK